MTADGPPKFAGGPHQIGRARRAARATMTAMTGARLAIWCAGGLALGVVGCSSRAATPAGSRTMDFTARITHPRPLTVTVALRNPADAPGPIWVPVMFEPLGAFVTVTVRDAAGAIACETHRPKFTPKLRPDADAAYAELGPGAELSAELVVEDCQLAPGQYQVAVGYRNLDYRGTAAHPIGELARATTLDLTL